MNKVLFSVKGAVRLRNVFRGTGGFPLVMGLHRRRIIRSSHVSKSERAKSFRGLAPLRFGDRRARGKMSFFVFQHLTRLSGKMFKDDFQVKLLSKV